MNDDPLHKLLELADAAAGPPHATVGIAAGTLAARVRRRARRRRVARATAAAAIVVAAFVAGAVRLTRPQPDGNRVARQATIPRATEPRITTAEQLQLERESAQLAAEAELHLLTAGAMMRREAEAARAAKARAAHAPGAAEAAPDVLDELAVRRDQAAVILLLRGDRLLRRHDRPDAETTEAAAASYRRVLELFPDTPQAAAARERLAQIRT